MKRIFAVSILLSVLLSQSTFASANPSFTQPLVTQGQEAGATPEPKPLPEPIQNNTPETPAVRAAAPSPTPSPQPPLPEPSPAPSEIPKWPFSDGALQAEDLDLESLISQGMDPNDASWSLLDLALQAEGLDLASLIPQKGISFYPEFPDVPDFFTYARPIGGFCIEYPTSIEFFNYLNNPKEEFSFSTKIYDYINVPFEKADGYKAYLPKLGFTSATYEVLKQNFGEFYEQIALDVLYDPEFSVDLDGVFYLNYRSEFTVVLVGKTNTYIGDFPILCSEVRLYSLTAYEEGSREIKVEIPDYAKAIISKVMEIDPLTGIKRYYYTPGLYELIIPPAKHEIEYDKPEINGEILVTPEQQEIDVRRSIDELEYFLIY